MKKEDKTILKYKITTEEWYNLPDKQKSKYMRFCGTNEVYYILSNLNTIKP